GPGRAGFQRGQSLACADGHRFDLPRAAAARLGGHVTDEDAGLVDHVHLGDVDHRGPLQNDHLGPLAAAEVDAAGAAREVHGDLEPAARRRAADGPVVRIKGDPEDVVALLSPLDPSRAPDVAGPPEPAVAFDPEPAAVVAGRVAPRLSGNPDRFAAPG